jgi:hypothetical protein
MGGYDDAGDDGRRRYEEDRRGYDDEDVCVHASSHPPTHPPTPLLHAKRARPQP